MTSTTRSALVTGASRGIGRGVALSLARQGYGLTITARSAVDLEEAAAQLRDVGASDVVHLAADMAERESLPALVALHERTFGSMNALIVNAGVGTAGRVEDFPLRRLDKTLEVNLVAALVLIQESLPMLRRAAAADPSRGARIVGLSSITGVYPEPGLAAYGSSKAALISVLETVNAEESLNGVNATAIAPGYVRTDMSAWVTDTIRADSMIPVDDVVRVVDLLLTLSPATSIPRLVISRAAGGGFVA